MKARFIWEVRLVMIHVKQSLFFRLHLSVRTRLETCVRRRGGLAVSRTEFVVLLMLALLITFLLIKARVLMVFETLVFRTFAVLSVTVLSVEAVLSITFFAFEMNAARPSGRQLSIRPSVHPCGGSGAVAAAGLQACGGHLF